MYLIHIDLSPIISDISLVLVCEIEDFTRPIARSYSLCDLRVMLQKLDLPSVHSDYLAA